MSVNEKMTALANEVRTLSDKTETLSIDEMTSTLNAENTNLITQAEIITQLENAIAGKAIGGGTDTSDATATENDLLSGKTAYAGGQKITGTIAFAPAKTITPTTTSQIAISSGYYASGNITVAAVPTQTKSATPTSSTQNITPDSGKFLSKVTITGDSNLVSDNIKKGTSIFGVDGSYEGSGGQSSENSIDDFLATEYTTYTNETVTELRKAIFARQPLTLVNFPACSYIGSYAFQMCQSLKDVSLPVCSFIGGYAFDTCQVLPYVNFPVCSYIGDYAFLHCQKISRVNIPECSSIGVQAFGYCSSLTSVNFPACSYLRNIAFIGCSGLVSASFGGNSIISKCTILSSVFASCKSLINLTLRYSFVATLSNINAFNLTPMSVSALTGSFGSIYVPASLVDAYKSATNWATYADRITAIQGEIEIELTDISVTYSGGSVSAGTSVSSLTDIVVTAHYSDGSSETVTGYTLSGDIIEGTNTITVTYGDKTTTFIVTGVIESGGDEGTLISFTISDTTYQADKDMTWEDWINSSYNTLGLIIHDSTMMGMTLITNSNKSKVLQTMEMAYVLPNEVILNNYPYRLALEPIM